MIYGVGIDCIQVDRIKQVLKRSGERFSRRILSTSEWQIYKKNKYPINFLAKRFAAKEAVSKAFGIGISHGLFFRHIEILNDSFGKPVLQLLSYAAILFEKLSLSSKHVSLSDDGCYVFAIVIFER